MFNTILEYIVNFSKTIYYRLISLTIHFIVIPSIITIIYPFITSENTSRVLEIIYYIISYSYILSFSIVTFIYVLYINIGTFESYYVNNLYIIHMFIMKVIPNIINIFIYPFKWMGLLSFGKNYNIIVEKKLENGTYTLKNNINITDSMFDNSSNNSQINDIENNTLNNSGKQIIMVDLEGRVINN